MHEVTTSANDYQMILHYIMLIKQIDTNLTQKNYYNEENRND